MDDLIATSHHIFQVNVSGRSLGAKLRLGAALPHCRILERSAQGMLAELFSNAIKMLVGSQVDASVEQDGGCDGLLVEFVAGNQFELVAVGDHESLAVFASHKDFAVGDDGRCTER